MTPAVLQNPIFTDETKAREWLEARVWRNGPTCPHCGNADADKITGLKRALESFPSIGEQFWGSSSGRILP
jgi:Transposase zinc-ribbon domain